MLKKIEGLPKRVIGLVAEGQLSKDDYEKVMIPLLEEEHRAGRRIRFLYHLGKEFSGFTAGAAWDDFRVGLRFVRLFEQCAVVTDIDWIRKASQFFGPLMPCPIKTFPNDQFADAVAWLEVPGAASKLNVELSEEGILILRPQGPLKREDFERVSSIVDPWIEAHQGLRGIVLCIEHFPGWENLGSLLRHLEFVRSHHRKVRRVAVAMDGALPEIMSKVAGHFVEAEVKAFPSSGFLAAKAWVRE